MASLLFNAIYF
ncbi:uncharacterized protein FFFS_16030 [Fusarium fujikuroi]|nr:uncharacterized protein FFFS_16030 [Fusarium fujikuroi]